MSGVHELHRNRYMVVVSLTGLASLLMTGSDVRECFVWNAQLGAREPWRFITGHLTHLNWGHLSANLAVSVLLCWIASGMPLVRTVTALAGAWLGITIGLAAGFWSIEWYAGLSGLLYGWFAGLALELCLRRGKIAWVGALLLVGGAIKIVLDVSAGPIIVGFQGVPVAAPAHLYGYAGGLAATTIEHYLWRCLRTA